MGGQTDVRIADESDRTRPAGAWSNLFSGGGGQNTQFTLLAWTLGQAGLRRRFVSSFSLCFCYVSEHWHSVARSVRPILFLPARTSRVGQLHRAFSPSTPPPLTVLILFSNLIESGAKVEMNERFALTVFLRLVEGVGSCGRLDDLIYVNNNCCHILLIKMC